MRIATFVGGGSWGGIRTQIGSPDFERRGFTTLEEKESKNQTREQLSETFSCETGSFSTYNVFDPLKTFP